MAFETVRWLVSRRPGWVVAAWLVAAVAVFATAPNLTQLAAEGQAKLTPEEVESSQAARVLRATWPDQSYESLVVLALHRPEGLKPEDDQFARTLSDRFTAPDKPAQVLRVMGPKSQEEIAARLISPDKTVQLLLVHLNTPFVSPKSFEAIDWLKEQADDAGPPADLELLWTGNAELGREYMRNVGRSLDRAAIATVFLLLGVLLAVYRSLLLALVPLVTIGVGLVISRSLLAWMNVAGWDVSPLVELFLVVILFGCGTDFCLFLSWRYGEHWNPNNPAGAMRATMKKAMGALLTSAFTVIAGLSLMGTTHFKLFSSTGPSVAFGLAVTLLATVTLTPSLLVLVARFRPRAFAGLTAPSSGFWNGIGRWILSRPLTTWVGTILLMLPLAALGTRTTFIQDLVSDLPAETPAVEALQMITDPPGTNPPRKFRQGDVAPLTVVLESDGDLHQSEGLALIDDISRLLSHQKQLAEVRSATQPLGSAELLQRARLSSRLAEVNEGFTAMADGARQLQEGLTQGAAKLRTAILFEDLTGVNVTGEPPAKEEKEKPAPKPSGNPLTSGFRQMTSALLGGGAPKPDTPAPKPNPADEDGGARGQMLRELTRAADGAGQIREGAIRAQHEVSGILEDPVGRHALDRLLITKETVRDNPDLLRSFATYIAPDGHRARIDMVQADRMFSAEALNQVETLRRRVGDYLEELRGPLSQAGFDLQLIPAPDGARAIPTEGQGLIIVADVQGVLLFRIFDDEGKMVVDTDEKKLTEHARPIADLRMQLARLWPPHELSQGDKDRVIAAVAAIVDHPPRAMFAGNNAESADVRSLTRRDQYQTWVIVPLGVFLILVVALRDFWACLNLVATMILTYAFALGATHLAFVSALGYAGIDWKVPFFLFVLLVAVGVDYNVFLMARLQEEVEALGLRAGITRAIAQTGGLISSAAAITACSFAALMFSPLSSLRQLGFALVVGITVDAVLVRPVLVPCGQWLLQRHRERRRAKLATALALDLKAPVPSGH